MLLSVGIIFSIPTLARTTVIVGGTIIDGNGGNPIQNGTIVIEDDRIGSVGTSHAKPPRNSIVIDARGKYIIPGLMDANVHLVYGFSTEYLIRFEDKFEDIIREGAQVALKSGVTTVFDTWGPLEPLKAVRAEINSGKLVASRLFVGGNIVGLSGPFSPDFYANPAGIAKDTIDRIDRMYENGTGHELTYLSAGQLRPVIDQYLNQGMDFLKYAVSGHGDYDTGFILFSPEAQKTLIEAGRRRNLVVETHTTSVESLRIAVEAGVDLVQHCNLTIRELIPEDLIREIATRKVPCAMQAYPQRFLKHALGDHFTQDPESIQDPQQRSEAVAFRNQQNLIAAGATVLMMTDGGVPYQDDVLLQDVFFRNAYPEIRSDIVGFFGTGHYAWLRGATEAGLSPMKALQAATRNVAVAYHKSNDLGTIEAGKLADLVILNADPLQDSKNYESVFLVMKSGRVVDRGVLPTQHVLTAQ